MPEVKQSLQIEEIQVQAFKQARDNIIDLQIANKNFQIRPWIAFFLAFYIVMVLYNIKLYRVNTAMYMLNLYNKLTLVSYVMLCTNIVWCQMKMFQQSSCITVRISTLTSNEFRISILTSNEFRISILTLSEFRILTLTSSESRISILTSNEFRISILTSNEY